MANFTGTFNPSDTGSNVILDSTYKIMTVSSSSGAGVRSSSLITSGKWYWEVSFTGVNQCFLGTAIGSVDLDTDPSSISGTYGLFNYVDLVDNGTVTSDHGSDDGPSDQVIGIAYDADAGKIYIRQVGDWLNSADPVAGANPSITGVPSSYIYCWASAMPND